MAAALPGATARRRQPHADKRSDLVAPRGSRQSNPTIVVVKARPPPSPCTPILHIASPETPPPTRPRIRYRAFCHNKQGFLTATRSPFRRGSGCSGQRPVLAYHPSRGMADELDALRRITQRRTRAEREWQRGDPPTLHRGPQHRPNRGRGGCAIRGRLVTEGRTLVRGAPSFSGASPAWGWPGVPALTPPCGAGPDHYGLALAVPSCDGVRVTVDFVPVPPPPGTRPSCGRRRRRVYSPAPGNEVTTRDLDPLRAASAQKQPWSLPAAAPPTAARVQNGAVVPDPVR